MSLIFVMSVLAGATAYITRIVMARHLSPTDYGLFTSIFTFITFFLFFRDLGVGHALSKYIPEYIVNKKFSYIKSGIVFVFMFQMVSSLLFAVIFFVLAPFLAESYFKDPRAVIILRILLLYLFGSVMFRMFRHVSNGFQNMKLFSVFDFLKNVIILLMISILFYFYEGIYVPTIAYAAVCYLVVLVTFPFMWKMFPITKYKIDDFKAVAKNIFYFGIPIFATSLAGKFISNADTLILTHYRDLAEVGVYNVVLPSAMIFLEFGTIVSSVIFPMFSELWAKKDSQRIQEALRIIYRYAFVIILPLALMIIAFAPFLLETFFGKEYVSGTLALQILIVGMLLFVVAGINNNIISAIGHPKTVAKIIMVSFFFNLTTNILFIPRFGITAAAATTAFSYLITLVLSTNRISHYLSIKYPKMIWVKLLFAGFVFYSIIKYIKAVSSFNPWVELVLAVGIAAIAYGFIVYAYDIIDITEIKKYFRASRR